MNRTYYLQVAGNVNIDKLIYISERRVTYKCKSCWTVDKIMASLSTCHLGVLSLMAIFFYF